jgi:hypothetical protein
LIFEEEAEDGSLGAILMTSTGAPHCPQKRLPKGTSALHFWHFNFKDDAQFKQIWMPSGF